MAELLGDQRIAKTRALQRQVPRAKCLSPRHDRSGVGYPHPDFSTNKVAHRARGGREERHAPRRLNALTGRRRISGAERGRRPMSSGVIHSGSSESRHSLITNDFTNPSRMNGSSLEKASASSRVLKMAMLPPSVNGPMPRTTPREMNLSTTALWRGYTAMIASRPAPEGSPMTTAFMRFLQS